MTKSWELPFIELYSKLEASRNDIHKLKECRKAFIELRGMPLIHLQFLQKLLNGLIKESVGADDCGLGIIKCYSVITSNPTSDN